MGEKTLKDIKEFHRAKKAIDLDLVDTGKIVVSDRFKHSEEGSKSLLAIKKMKLLNYYVLYYHK